MTLIHTLLLLLTSSILHSFTAVHGFTPIRSSSSSSNSLGNSNSMLLAQQDRRSFLFANSAAAAAVVVGGVMGLSPTTAVADGSEDGLLSDLPPEAARSYLQYRIPLQISADYYMWELQGKIADPDSWGEINEIFQVNNNKGQGNPSRVERDFVNPMRILGLSMPPDVADEMRDAQFEFERAAQGITKATKGVRRDLPVELDPSDLKNAQLSWEKGRLAINSFFASLNAAVGMKEMTMIPPAGPNQTKEYGRSQKRYFELTKKTKLCQNRGGPTLSQAWGGLMITGYLQDSCGIPDLEEYFYQR